MSLALRTLAATFHPTRPLLRHPRPLPSACSPILRRDLLPPRSLPQHPARSAAPDPPALRGEIGEAEGESISLAFSSMVLIIRELHSCALQLRERGIAAQVQRDMHASFCWLFQQIFSRTPALMLSLMLLLANFSLHSVARRELAAAPAPLCAARREMEEEGERRWRPAEEFRREMAYRTAVEEEPCSGLLLANYAQFLFLVARDHDRAEHYFKRAIQQKPPDPAALSRYAQFLWVARGDLLAAEERYLDAIAADPSNASYAADYAHFLWSTGGSDTCFLLVGHDYT